MIGARLRAMFGATLLLIALGVVVLLLTVRAVVPPPSPRDPVTAAARATSGGGPVGSASCSAQACHGGIEPRTGENALLRNEYTTWATRDRHARAYEALLSAEGREIARRLGGGPAHESRRCLACHSQPQGADGPSSSPAEGVGCEACHGPAGGWLAKHTTPGWATTAEEYRLAGMLPLAEVGEVAATCARCHVGAAPEDGRPARDVNHDLLAAGHPRLSFEFTGYLNAMPPHWDSVRRALVRKPDFEARAWAVGQLVSARSALALLKHRADHAGDEGATRTPWPELAEYDCYACHHDLRREGWRQERDDERPPGALPWGTWYFTMPRLIAEENGYKAPPEGDALARLRRQMANPSADRGALVDGVGRADELLGNWQDQVKGQTFDLEGIRARLRVLARDDRKLVQREWESAAQLYQALRAFDRARADLLAGLNGRAGEAPEALGSLGGRLAFPDGYRSPKTYRIEAAFDDELRQLLEKLSRE